MRVGFAASLTLGLVAACSSSADQGLPSDSGGSRDAEGDAGVADVGGGSDADIGFDAEAAPDAQPQFVEVCGDGFMFPESFFPVPDVATIIIASFGVPIDERTALHLMGPENFSTPGACLFHAPPGRYAIDLLVDSNVLASTELDVAAETTTILAAHDHPALGAGVDAFDYDMSATPPGMWRMLFLNVAPETSTTAMGIFVYPPDTPRFGAATATATKVGSVPFGEVLSVLVPAHTLLLSLIPEQAQPVATSSAAYPLIGCGADAVSIANIVWCDSLDPFDDENGPCFGTLGAQWWLASFLGVPCFQ